MPGCIKLRLCGASDCVSCGVGGAGGCRSTAASTSCRLGPARAAALTRFWPWACPSFRRSSAADASPVAVQLRPSLAQQTHPPPLAAGAAPWSTTPQRRRSHCLTAAFAVARRPPPPHGALSCVSCVGGNAPRKGRATERLGTTI